jgi:ubiquinone/menaquinone biosynthesis C-methylase UbiE
MDFSDTNGYERFMGRWSRAVAPHFLQWIAPARRRKWLDVGCGTGILTEAVLDLCDPLAVVGIDQSTAQVQQASRGPAGQRAMFQQADAADLPFPDASFDIVASALVLNFIPKPALAVQEMRRVARPGGILSGYVWDFGRDLSPSGPLRRAMRSVGAEVPDIPGTAHSSEQALCSLLAEAGLHCIESRTIDITLAYSDFEDFWGAQTPRYSPTTAIINAMSESERRRLKRAVHEALAVAPGGKIEYSARVNAVRASATG